MTAPMRLSDLARKAIATGLCCSCSLLPALGQDVSIAPVRPQAPVIMRPYMAPAVPPVRMANSSRLAQLIRAGTLYLTVQDAIALALENNLDIEISRYNPIITEWRLERAQAGGALPGVPSNASQAGAVAAGQGVAGSQAAAGVRGGGTNTSKSPTANATISQVGPVTQTLDPSIQEATTFSHTTLPQPNASQSATPVLISNTRASTGSYQQGFLSGGGVSVTYSDNYLNENSPTDVLNPSSAPNLSIAAQHNLLRGFGVAVNARTITVAKMNIHTSDLDFRTQVNGVVTQVLNAYYSLSADTEDAKAKKNAADTAQTFFANVKEQIRLGSVAPPDAITAETQAITSQQAVVDADAAIRKDEIQLKALLSRTGTADPLLSSTRIVPVDRISIPAKDDFPPLEEMVKQALANRSDLAAARASIDAAKISALGTQNGVLPTLQVFAGESQAGLSGAPRTIVVRGQTETADPYFVGGIGNALGQVFRHNFPTERIGAFVQAPIYNRQAQADYAIDQLQLRQTELNTRKTLNQAEVDVQNYVIAIEQARARYEAAVRNRVLHQDLFSSEQKRFGLGASTAYDVTQQQRDLVTGQSSEVAALVAYMNARIALDQTLGRTLEVNHVKIDEARTGKVR